jgi:hypothetical protein
MRTLTLILATTIAGCGTAVTVEPVLQVVAISPGGGAANVNVDTNITATFSSRLEEATVVGSNVYLMDLRDTTVDAEISFDGTTITLDPVEDLFLSEDYTLVLTTSLLSATDGPLLSQIESTFRTTGDSPQNDLPIAEISGPAEVAPGDLVSLSGVNSFDPEAGSLTYSWSLDSSPAGSAAVLSSEMDETTSFEADLEGIYLVSLVVNDGSQDSDVGYLEITSVIGGGGTTDTGDTGITDTGSTDTGSTGTGSNTAPVADAGSDQAVVLGDTVELDGSNSYDDDGDSLLYGWTFVSVATGSTLTDDDIAGLYSATPSFTPDVAGLYVLGLGVTDGTDYGTDSIAITVASSFTN